MFPGTAAVAGLHFGDSNWANDEYMGLSWSGTTTDTESQAGIYIRSSGSYGTRMYFGTTQSYATGVQLGWEINERGMLSALRAPIDVNTPNIDFGSDIGEKISYWGTNYGVGVESGTLFWRAGTTFRWYPGTTAAGGDGGATDVMELSAIAGDTILTTPRLRLTATNDLSVSSTLHGFQVGPDSGDNVGIDGNEIMRRTNGVASTLNLNINGGTVAVGADITVASTADDSVDSAGGFDSNTGVFDRAGEHVITNDGTTTFAYYNNVDVARTHTGGWGYLPRWVRRAVLRMAYAELWRAAWLHAAQRRVDLEK